MTNDARESTVATIPLYVRRGLLGEPVWIADGKYEAATAEEALRQVGAALDHGLAQVPGFGWGER
jgi:hypothetical protein